MSNSDYARVLLPLIPREAFAPSPGKLVVFAAHFVVIVACWFTFPHVARTWWPLLALVIGMSLACLPFLAHDVSHKTVVRDPRLRYPIEVLIWALVAVPATVWARVHSYHHVVTNTVDDPKRRFTSEEASPARAAYSAVFLPHRGFKYNALCLLFFVTFTIRNTLAAFYPGRAKPQITPGKPGYTPLDRIKIAFELAVIVAIQFAIYKIAGRVGYWYAGLIPLIIVSAVSSIYFFTSHSLRPLREDGDALEGTTSVVVPRVVDRLHFHISYHSEHHLFPNMNSDYYPLVGKLMQQHFPGAYHRVGIFEAWSQIWKLPLYTAAPSTAHGAAQKDDGSRAGAREPQAVAR